MEKLLSVNNEDKNDHKINVTGDPLTNFLFKDYFRLVVVMFVIFGIFPLILGLNYETTFGIPSKYGYDNQIYLFSWNKIPGNDNVRLTENLTKKFDIAWVKKAEIEKINNNKTIRIFNDTEKKSLSLILNNDKNKINLTIDNENIGEFNAKTEGDEIKIYTKFTPIINDYFGQILAILAIAVSILIKNLFDTVADVFSSLPKKQIFKINDTDYVDFFQDFQKDFNDKRKFLVCLLIIPNLTVTPFVFSGFIKTQGMWFNGELFQLSWAYWFLVLYFFWFGLSLLAWKVYVIVKYIRRLGNNDFDLQIMHPDRCSGFKSIGDLCFNINMVSFSIGIAFASMMYFIPLKEQPQILFYLVLYICASFFFFFYPIMGIHNAMQNRKIELMNKISVNLKNQNFFENIYKNGNVDKETLKKIQDIREINSEISKIPVWPFDSETLRKFVTATVLPVIIAITSKII
ncbi:MAG: hypothetical protein O8C61_01085 [Candidatus Methanoperedens sp.]|nr:hypothetical protein [Candidatus Methanoperedens sp.]